VKNRLVFAGLALALGLSVLAPAGALALGKDAGLTISPLRAYPSQDPGVTTASNITLSNLTKSPMGVSIGAELFKTIDESYDYAFAPTADKSWIRFDDSNISLQAGQTQKENYAVAVPASAKAGGYYFAIVATVKAQTSSVNFTILKQVTSLIYLQVHGNISHQMSLLGTNTPWLTTTPSVDISARVANGGTSHDEAALDIPVRYWPWGGGGNGQVLQGLILPSTIRRLDGNLKLGGVPGIYQVTVKFSPPQGGSTTKTHYVLYFPVWFAALLVIGGFYLTRNWSLLVRKLKQQFSSL